MLRKDKQRFHDQAYINALVNRLMDSCTLVGNVLASAGDAELDETSPIEGLEKEIAQLVGSGRSSKFQKQLIRLESTYVNIDDWLRCVGEPGLD